MTQKTTQLENLKKEALKCQNCELYKTKNKTVFSDGCENAPIMFIGEAPGQNEDETGIPFIGRAGQLLRKFLFEVDIKQDDIYIANTIKCRPPKNRKPTQVEKNAIREAAEKTGARKVYLEEEPKVAAVGAGSSTGNFASGFTGRLVAGLAGAGAVARFVLSAAIIHCHFTS